MGDEATTSEGSYVKLNLSKKFLLLWTLDEVVFCSLRKDDDTARAVDVIAEEFIILSGD